MVQINKILIRCFLCHSSNVRIEANNKQMRWDCWGYKKFIIKCQKCGLMFIYPQWTQEELNKLYIGYTDLKDFYWQKQAARITKYLTKYIRKDDLILEIGSGKGENVMYLNKLGYVINGIDKDQTYCDKKLTFYADYKNSNVENIYSFIYAIQVFEHLDYPKDFIIKIMNMLRKKGRFLLEFPNTEDPILTLYHVENFKKFYYIPHHLFFWTPSTIQRFFDDLGIKIEIKLLQKYGILNHLRWIIFGVPGNWHPHIPIIDFLYKSFLTHILKKSDTIIALGKKNE